MVVVYGYCIGISPYGPSMDLHWDVPLAIPWPSSMGSPLGFCPSAFYGIALVHLIVTSMESLLWVAHWDDPTMGTPWHCFGSSQWCFHGCCLWLLDLGSPYGPSMELHVGLLIGHAMAFFYG